MALGRPAAGQPRKSHRRNRGAQQAAKRRRCTAQQPSWPTAAVTLWLLALAVVPFLRPAPTGLANAAACTTWPCSQSHVATCEATTCPAGTYWTSLCAEPHVVDEGTCSTCTPVDSAPIRICPKVVYRGTSDATGKFMKLPGGREVPSRGNVGAYHHVDPHGGVRWLDANYLMIASVTAGAGGHGAVEVFKVHTPGDIGKGMTLVQRLEPSANGAPEGIGFNVWFGETMTANADGSIVVIGAPDTSIVMCNTQFIKVGRAYVFTRQATSPASWTQTPGYPLDDAKAEACAAGVDGNHQHAMFGRSVSLAPTVPLLAVSRSQNGGDEDKVFLYEPSVANDPESEWVRSGFVELPVSYKCDNAWEREFGENVVRLAETAGGMILAVDAAEGDRSPIDGSRLSYGAVHIFSPTTPGDYSAWTHRKRLTAWDHVPAGACSPRVLSLADWFGRGLELTPDGKWLAVAATVDPTNGISAETAYQTGAGSVTLFAGGPASAPWEFTFSEKLRGIEAYRPGAFNPDIVPVALMPHVSGSGNSHIELSDDGRFLSWSKSVTFQDERGGLMFVYERDTAMGSMQLASVVGAHDEGMPTSSNSPPDRLTFSAFSRGDADAQGRPRAMLVLAKEKTLAYDMADVLAFPAPDMSWLGATGGGACWSNSECPFSQQCDFASGWASRPGRVVTSKSFCAAQCVDFSCPGGLLPAPGQRCLKASGTACSADSECMSDYCLSGVCTVPPDCADTNTYGANRAHDRTSNTCVCDVGFQLGRLDTTASDCLAAAGYACSADADCASAHCASGEGTCKKAWRAACSLDGECASGTCANGWCAGLSAGVTVAAHPSGANCSAMHVPVAAVTAASSPSEPDHTPVLTVRVVNRPPHVAADRNPLLVAAAADGTASHELVLAKVVDPGVYYLILDVHAAGSVKSLPLRLDVACPAAEAAAAEAVATAAGNAPDASSGVSAVVVLKGLNASDFGVGSPERALLATAVGAALGLSTNGSGVQVDSAVALPSGDGVEVDVAAMVPAAALPNGLATVLTLDATRAGDPALTPLQRRRTTDMLYEHAGRQLSRASQLCCTATVFADDNATCASIHGYYPELPSGTYTVTGYNGGNPLEVYCDMETDGGGWMLHLAKTGKYNTMHAPQVPVGLKTLTQEGRVATADGDPPVGQLRIQFYHANSPNFFSVITAREAGNTGFMDRVMDLYNNNPTSGCCYFANGMPTKWIAGEGMTTDTCSMPDINANAPSLSWQNSVSQATAQQVEYIFGSPASGAGGAAITWGNGGYKLCDHSTQLGVGGSMTPQAYPGQYVRHWIRP